MAGSKQIFPYTLDNGTIISVELDESNVEDVNQNVNLVPQIGSIIFPVASQLRYALYSNGDNTITRKVVILGPAAIPTIPPVITVNAGTGAAAGTQVQLGLSTTRGEKFRRYRGGDSGLNDGDIP